MRRTSPDRSKSSPSRWRGSRPPDRACAWKESGTPRRRRIRSSRPILRARRRLPVRRSSNEVSATPAGLPMPPKKQRQSAEQSAGPKVQPAAFAQIGRQPGDVEIPAIAQAEILHAQQPHVRRSHQRAPRRVAVLGGRLDVAQQFALGGVHLRIFERVVAEPTIEHHGPHHAQAAEDFERVPPSHESRSPRPPAAA